MKALLVALIASATVSADAHADFVLINPQPPAANVAALQPQAPVPDEARNVGAAEQPKPTASRFKMAYGFGDQVPLSFACRQIVPPVVKVVYGPGADPHRLVSWKGGDTWNHALRAAVRPLGLHLVMTTMAVEIRK